MKLTFLGATEGITFLISAIDKQKRKLLLNSGVGKVVEINYMLYHIDSALAYSQYRR